MVYLTALLPMVQGIGAFAALDRHARTMIGTGQAGERTRGQIMADSLVERLTGQETAAAVPVEVHLVMTDTALLRGDGRETPAWVVGHGPFPSGAARQLLGPERDGPAGDPRVWLRRLYTHPETGELVAMDSKRRLFDGLLRRMVILRDDTCRSPWCDAPIRHVDHAIPHSAGGSTTYENASGLCERCNQNKESERWRHAADPARLAVTTPTGHTYWRTTLPLGPLRPPGQTRRRRARSGSARDTRPRRPSIRRRGRRSRFVRAGR